MVRSFLGKRRGLLCAKRTAHRHVCQQGRRRRRRYAGNADTDQIGEGLHAIDLAGLDQRGDVAPGLASLVMTGEERILAVASNWADQIFDPVVRGTTPSICA